MRKQALKDKTKMHREGTSIFLGWLQKSGALTVLKKRAKRSFNDFTKLRSKGITLSPFLEMGAGRCQSALVLTNFFNAAGICTDISLDSLKEAETLSKQLETPKMPTRICCDAYNLPFRDETFAFAYCYSFLHHLPDPAPVLKEIKRILKNGGFFFFSFEPIKGKIMPTPLKRHPKPTSNIEKVFSKLRILPYISTPDYGVFETSFNMQKWMKLLSIFDKKEAHVATLRSKITIDFSKCNLRMTLCSLTGGSLQGLCKVKK